MIARPTAQRSITRIAKDNAIPARVDDGALEIAGHSLRSGAAAKAAINGASPAQILQLGGWKDSRTALRHIQEKEAWEDTPGEKLGL